MWRAAVDDERRRRGDARRTRAVGVARHPRRVRPVDSSARKRSTSSPNRPASSVRSSPRSGRRWRRARRASPRKRPGRRRLGGLGGALRVGVDLGQRQMAEREAQPAVEPLAHARDDRLRGRAVRALEVAVHDQLQRSVRRAEDVIGGVERRQGTAGDPRLPRSVDELELLFALLFAAVLLVRAADFVGVPYPIVLVLGGLGSRSCRARRHRARRARRPARLPPAAAALGGLVLVAARAARREPRARALALALVLVTTARGRRRRARVVAG